MGDWPTHMMQFVYDSLRSSRRLAQVGWTKPCGSDEFGGSATALPESEGTGAERVDEIAARSM